MTETQIHVAERQKQKVIFTYIFVNFGMSFYTEEILGLCVVKLKWGVLPVLLMIFHNSHLKLSGQMWSLIHQLNALLRLEKFFVSNNMGRSLGNALCLSLSAYIYMYVHINSHVFELLGWKSSVEFNI